MGIGLGAIIGGGAGIIGDIIGGELDRQAQERTSKRNIAAQREANDQNAALQREFAQMGLRWKVEDAKAAGLNPLAALGASGASASPSFVSYNEEPNYHRGSSIRNAGQDLSRAFQATLSPEEKLRQRLMNERMALENILLKDDVSRRINAPDGGFPADGNSEIGGLGGQATDLYKWGPSGPVQIMPLGRTASPAGKPYQAYGSTTRYAYNKMPDGSLEVVSSPDVQGDKANDLISMLKFHIQRAADLYGNPKSMAPSYQDHPLPPGMEWEFRTSTGRFHPVKAGQKRPWYRRLLYR